LAFYRSFVQRNAGDPRVQYELAVAQARAGAIAAVLEHRDEACEHFQQARDILERLLADQPTQSRYRMMLFRVYHQLGENSRKLDQFDDAAAAFDRRPNWWVTHVRQGPSRGKRRRWCGWVSHAARSRNSGGDLPRGNVRCGRPMTRGASWRESPTISTIATGWPKWRRSWAHC
jgi:hypothetical protein